MKKFLSNLMDKADDLRMDMLDHEMALHEKSKSKEEFEQSELIDKLDEIRDLIDTKIGEL